MILGGKTLGSFGVCGAILSKETLGTIATLIAIAIGRARTIELLSQSKAARENERFKSALLDAIAHDFKTPLTAIKLAATSLLEELSFSGKQGRELLVIVDEECDRLNRVVGEAIDMARLDAANVKLQVATHTVDELVSAAIEDCKNIQGTRQIKTEVSEPRRSVRADLFWTTRVFDHLIRNADLYSSRGQPITISMEDQNGFVLFHVADIGPGIDESEIQHIFEKFYRGKRQRHRVPGTGMGLAVAKAIIEAHGGKIEATSEPGRGATFTFSLPRE
jgi:two-component system, OmpR family, sensor histidine kinase KdpD